MDDEAARTLFCGNLSEKVTEKLLYELFLQAGPLVSATIPKKDGKQRNFAFITFKHEVSVQYAIALMDEVKLFGKQLHLAERSGSNKGPNPYLEKLRQYRNSVSQQSHHKDDNSLSSSMRREVHWYDFESTSSESDTDRFDRYNLITESFDSLLDSKKREGKTENHKSRFQSKSFKARKDSDTSQFHTRRFDTKTENDVSHSDSRRYEARKESDGSHFDSEARKESDASHFDSEARKESYASHFDSRKYEARKESDASYFDSRRYEGRKESNASCFDSRKYKSRKESDLSHFDCSRYESRKESDASHFESRRHEARKESEAVQFDPRSVSHGFNSGYSQQYMSPQNSRQGYNNRMHHNQWGQYK